MSAEIDLDRLNRMLGAGVHLMRFTLEPEGGRFMARLELIDTAGAKHTLVCRDVQNLELTPEGDALTRPMRLQVEDMREDRLDRVRFSLEETDRDTLFLHCDDLGLDPAGG